MDKWVVTLIVGAVLIIIGFGFVKGFKFKGAEAELQQHKVGGTLTSVAGVLAFIVGILGLIGFLPGTTTGAAASGSSSAAPPASGSSTSVTPASTNASPTVGETLTISTPTDGATVKKLDNVVIHRSGNTNGVYVWILTQFKGGGTISPQGQCDTVDDETYHCNGAQFGETNTEAGAKLQVTAVLVNLKGHKKLRELHATGYEAGADPVEFLVASPPVTVVR